MRKKTIGIIGGMGPLATVDLFKRLVEHTAAEKDADHIHIIIDNYPQIPDRTKAILSGDNSVIPYLIEAGKRLETAGAEILLIPCNTSHYFYDALCENLTVPVINMIRECAKKALFLGYKKVALLATDGVTFSGVYSSIFSEYGIEVLLPSAEGQKQVMHIIYNEVKAGKPSHPEMLYAELSTLKANGAEAFVLGCTELPIVFSEKNTFTFIDPTSILVEAVINAAGYKYKK